LKKTVIILSVVMSVILLSAAGIIGYRYFMPNSKVVAAFDEGKLHLIIGSELIGDGNPKIYNGEIMLPFDMVKKYLDPSIYWDEALKKVTVTTKDRVIRMKTDNLNAMINNKPIDLKIPVIEEWSRIIFVEQHIRLLLIPRPAWYFIIRLMISRSQHRIFSRLAAMLWRSATPIIAVIMDLV